MMFSNHPDAPEASSTKIGVMPLSSPATPSRSGALVRFEGAGVGRCAQPRGFRGAEGVRSAEVRPSGPFGRTPSLRGKTDAQKNGIRYERKVIASLERRFSGLRRDWFEYTIGAEGAARSLAGEARWCQPDAYVRIGGRTVIFEVKYSFTSDGWYQLRRLYEPVLRVAFPLDTIHLVLIVKVFDPARPFPEDFVLIDDKTYFIPDFMVYPCPRP